MNVIRPAEDRDIPGVMRLLVQVDMVHHMIRPDLFKGPATKYTEDELKTIFRDKKTPVFVCADENGQVLGHCFCCFKQHAGHNVLTDVKTLYIDDLCVDEAHRGQHIGKALYDFVPSAKVFGSGIKIPANRTAAIIITVFFIFRPLYSGMV